MKYYVVVKDCGEDFITGEHIERLNGCCSEPEKEMLEAFQFVDENDRFVEISEDEYAALCRVWEKIHPRDFGEMYGGEGLLCD